jgi:hypothetical protein
LWGIASLVDAFHVPKFLSQQLLPFGRSGDGLEVLTFEVEQFFALSVRREQSASVWRTIRGLAVRRVFFVFLLAFIFDPLCFRVLVGRGFGRSACAGRTIRRCRADSPRVPGGQSVCSPRTVRFSGFASGGSVGFNGQSAAQAGQSAVPVRTVRGTLADGPLGSCGQSAPPGRTVRQSLAALFLGSIPPLFFRASACASRNCS